MKVLVTGAKGQLGQDILRLLEGYSWEVFGLGRAELDITNQQRVNEKVFSIKPDVIIHTAAYTQVDQAESDEEMAFKVNGDGTKYLAQAAEGVGAKFCYVSTDYVFDGKSKRPYKPEDQTNPQTVYGKSKLAGEQYTIKYCSKYFIVRTSWVFGLYGNNFVKTMLRLAEERNELGVVHDQIGSPTYTGDLAKFLVEVTQNEKYGIYHASNSGSCSWYEFAQEIFKVSNKSIVLKSLKTEEYPTPAKRPYFSVMDNRNDVMHFPHWSLALQLFIRQIKGIKK
ncbi:TPA: dTDP-4-dehydrorhamnose reductase [Bacillus paranthracis]